MPENPSHHPHDKADIHIPGAGTIGMAILIVSLSILFIASIVAYMLIRRQTIAAENTPVWPPPGLPPVPQSLWLSTLVIILSSFTIQIAYRAIRRGNEQKLRTWLWITFALGLLFLVCQSFNWIEFYHAIPKNTQFQGAYLGMFFVLTGLHAAHVLGGLIPMAVVIAHAHKGRYSPNFHPGVRYCALYWHFLDLVWITLFCFLYF